MFKSLIPVSEASRPFTAKTELNREALQSPIPVCPSVQDRLAARRSSGTQPWPPRLVAANLSGAFLSADGFPILFGGGPKSLRGGPKFGFNSVAVGHLFDSEVVQSCLDAGRMDQAAAETKVGCPRLRDGPPADSRARVGCDLNPLLLRLRQQAIYLCMDTDMCIGRCISMSTHTSMAIHHITLCRAVPCHAEAARPTVQRPDII